MTPERIERVKAMEEILNRMTKLQMQVDTAIQQWSDALPDYERLIGYYGSPDWHQDYDDDDRGLFPEDLARSILTEDLIYNMMIAQRELAIYTAKVAIDAIEKA